MRAILISAGKGTRLYPLTKDMPKCLMTVGNGKTVIEQQLLTLRRVGITDVVVILGYMAEKVENVVNKYKDDLSIRVVYNPFYDVSNNLISLWMAKYFMDVDFISINGDNIFHPDVIRKLLKTKGKIVMTIDRKEKYDIDDMKVVIKDNRVYRVGKDIPLIEANGESVGIIKYFKSGRSVIANKLEAMVRKPENHGKFYLQALQEIMNEEKGIEFCEIEEKEWAEIDFHMDLEFVRRNINRFEEKLKKWK